MKFTKTGNEYIATTGTGIYTIRKSPVFTSQWEATVRSVRQFNVGGPRVHAATTFYTLRDAKEWCADDHAYRTN